MAFLFEFLGHDGYKFSGTNVDYVFAPTITRSFQHVVYAGD